MRIGISGHQELPNAETWNWVRATMGQVIAENHGKTIGYTSLAKGADQLFADVVLEFGGTIHAIIPFEGYERTLEGPALKCFGELLKKASVEILNVGGSDEEAFLAAGKRIVDLAEIMIAVWNGKSARGIGGTADIVNYSRTKGIPVFHLNPIDETLRQYV